MITGACKHCGEITHTPPFCCAGCKAAYHIIQDLGFNKYYVQKENDAQVRPNIPEAPLQIDFKPFIFTENNIHTMHLMVDGIHCAACVWLIEHVLQQNSYILHARVNMTSKRLTIKWQGKIGEASTLIKSIHQIGYRVMPFDPKTLKSKQKEEEKKILLYMAIAGFASANIMLLSVSLWSGIEVGSATANFMQWISALIALPTLVYAGTPFYKSAWSALKFKRLNMDVPISIALITTGTLSLYEAYARLGETYFDSVVMLLFFLLIGRYLDIYMKNKTFSIAENLLSLEASSATLINEDGRHQTIAIKEIKVGDILLIRAGEHLPTDGIIIQGTTEIDNSIVTGESIPLTCNEGASIIAGALNINATIQLKATHTTANSTLNKIASLIENSCSNKNRFTGIADKAARIYAPAVHLLAFITFSYWFFIQDTSLHDAILCAVAVLIVTCPCALALSVPAVHVAVTSNLLKRGILLKNATAIERLVEISHIIFDKTGTLTTGKFKLLNQPSAAQLNLAANIAKHSLHPLCVSLQNHIKENLDLHNISEKSGAGMTCTYQGKTIKLGSRLFCQVKDETTPSNSELWLKKGDNKAVPFYFEDAIKDDAPWTISMLKRLSPHITLLSGDNEKTVKNVADAVHIENYKSLQTPQQKHSELENLKQQGIRTLMVGDGINDAPALAEAYASMSFSNASHISQNCADIILQSPHLIDVYHTLRLAQKAHSAVKINFALSLGYNSIAIPLAMMGYITPLYAALFMSASSLMVMLNALRLRK